MVSLNFRDSQSQSGSLQTSKNFLILCKLMKQNWINIHINCDFIPTERIFITPNLFCFWNPSPSLLMFLDE